MTPSASASSSSSSSSSKRPTRTSSEQDAPPALTFSSHGYPFTSSDPASHSHSEDLQRGSLSCSSPPTSPTWREARTRDWPVAAQRRRRYDTEGDMPPARGPEAKVVRAVAALEKDLPGSRVLSDGRSEEEEKREAPRALRKGSKKSRQGTQQSAVRRRKGRRSIGAMAVLPLQYLLLVLLHLGFWIITASVRALARSRRWPRRRSIPRAAELVRLEEELLNIRRRNALRQEEQEALLGSSKEELRVPQHVALAFPPSPPPTSSLLARLLLRYFNQLLAFDSEAVSSRQSFGRLSGKPSPPSARQVAYEEEEAARRVLSLRSAVRWCALLGVAEVSVWDEGGEISRWLASGSEGGYETCSGTWRMAMDLEEEQVPIVIEVRDGERRMQLASKGSKTRLQSGEVHSENLSGSPLHLVLNLLTPRCDGRTAFAELSDTFVRKIRREEEDTVTGDDHGQTHKVMNGRGGADSKCDWLSKRIDSIGVAEVEEQLRGQGLPYTEPDLLIVSGGDPIARTLSDFPRWMIRVTEIFHAAPSASVCSQQDSDVIQANARLAQLSIHDFFAALGQFTNAEQRYGK